MEYSSCDFDVDQRFNALTWSIDIAASIPTKTSRIMMSYIEYDLA